MLKSQGVKMTPRQIAEALIQNLPKTALIDKVSVFIFMLTIEYPIAIVLKFKT